MAEAIPTSFAFAGSGNVDTGNAVALLDDFLPQDFEDGTPGIGAIYRPTHVPRSASGLNAVVSWLEQELGKRSIHPSDDLVASLVERTKAGNHAILVVVWPAEPSDEEQELVLAAREAGIRVVSLGDAIDDLLWEPVIPEEPAAEAAAAPVEEVTQAVAASFEDDIARLLKYAEQIIRSIVRDELAKHGTPHVASREDVAKVAAKLSGGKAGDDAPPFDGPYTTPKFRAEPGGGGDEEKVAYYLSEDGGYRKVKGRPRKGERRVMLTLDEIDRLVHDGKITDN